MTPEPTCAECGRPTIEHKRGECETREPKLYELPIFAWAWREDGKDLRA